MDRAESYGPSPVCADFEPSWIKPFESHKQEACRWVHVMPVVFAFRSGAAKRSRRPGWDVSRGAAHVPRGRRDLLGRQVGYTLSV